MKNMSAQWWAEARQARQQIEALVSPLPEFRMIDIGVDPEGESTIPVLRVHLSRTSTRDAARDHIPIEIAGILVRVIYGDYEPQDDQAGKEEFS